MQNEARRLDARKSDSLATRHVYRGTLESIYTSRWLRPIGPNLVPVLDVAGIVNDLPNSGPLRDGTAFASAEEIVAAHANPAVRSLGIPALQGYAVDDAVFEEGNEAWELWSNAALAGWLARYGCRHYSNPTMLELGCGPAHLYYFFREFGLSNYFGIDGNPYFLRFNRLLRGSEQHFRTLNLQDRIRLSSQSKPLKFDMILSFEVLEHINEAAIDNFLWTIREHMRVQSIFIGTASTIEAYDVHVLVRSRDWWLERFAKFGLYPTRSTAKLSREACDHHPFNWTGEHTNVFLLQLQL
jgi:SAM-dependent methyltransferase